MRECDLCRGGKGFALVDFIGSLVDQLVTQFFEVNFRTQFDLDFKPDGLYLVI